MYKFIHLHLFHHEDTHSHSYLIYHEHIPSSNLIPHSFLIPFFRRSEAEFQIISAKEQGIWISLTANDT